jgi:hypothetical protein
MPGKCACTVALRLFDVVPPSALDPRHQFVVDSPDDTRGNAKNQRSGWNHHTLRQHRACAHHGASTDPNTVQQDSPHSNEGFVLDGATMENRAMTDTDATADRTGKALVNVNQGEILDV